MKFRKKPVVIEAVQWFPPGSSRWPGPIDEIEILVAGPNHPTSRHGEFLTATIKTLEGGLTVTPGDWIITGVKGEKYPCKPDIFEVTYEPVIRSPAVTEPDDK